MNSSCILIISDHQVVVQGGELRVGGAGVRARGLLELGDDHGVVDVLLRVRPLAVVELALVLKRPVEGVLGIIIIIIIIIATIMLIIVLVIIIILVIVM